MPGFVHMLYAAQNPSLACCATLYTYVDATLITKPHGHALCMRFAEARHLHHVIVRASVSSNKVLARAMVLGLRPGLTYLRLISGWCGGSLGCLV